MIVPNLTIDIELHKADTALDKSTGDQATTAIGITFPLPNTVHRLGLYIFLPQIQCIGRRQLHPCGQTITGDPRREAWLPAALAPVPLIDFVDERALGLRDSDRLRKLTLQVENRGASSAKTGSLVLRRQKTRLPALNRIDREPLRVIQNNIGWQILVLGAQTIRDPGTQ